MMNNAIRAVIFDLDGTLVDSAPDLHAAALKMLAERGHPAIALDQVQSFIGNGVPKLVARCLAAVGETVTGGGRQRAVERFLAHYAAAPVDLTRPYPGVKDLLANLRARGVPMGICTNKPETLSHQVLEGLDLRRYFAVVVGGDTFPVIKPDPTPLLHCAESLAAPIARTLFVGDAETDAATARAAGAPLALYSGGYRKSPIARLKPDFAFDHFSELAEYLEHRTGAGAARS